jgi:acetolactate decarboxylase
MKISLVLFLIISLLLTSCREECISDQIDENSDAITQYGSKAGFLERSYVGTTTYEEIKKQGDFAIGTFNYVDGEMAAINNNFMRIPASGEVHPASDSLMAPFAVIKHFKVDNSLMINEEKSMNEIWSIVKEAFTDTSKPIAIKVTGSFASVKARSIHKETEPFQSLPEIVANQVIFNLEDVSGSMIGYWFPKYMDGVNFPGFHFHFLNDDLTKGGHLLDCIIKQGEIEIDYADKLVIK